MNAFISYKVNTKSKAGATTVVVRRYNEFAWLRQQLIDQKDGWLVPPLPEKVFLGRFSPVFVDSRRRGLELFLNRIAEHPVLSQAEDVYTFLHGSDEELAAARKQKTSASGKAKGVMSFFSSMAQSVTSSLSGSTEHDKTPDDEVCDNIEEYSDSLHSSVDAVYKNVYQLTRRTKSIANAWFEFGFSCTLLGQYETEQQEQELGNAFGRLGSAADRLSVLVSQQVDTQLVNFQEPFEDLLRQIDAVKVMLKARTAASDAYYSSLSTLNSQQAKLEKLRSQPGKESRAAECEKQILDLTSVVTKNEKRLQTVTQRVFSEVARFRKEMRQNFKTMMLAFVQMQIDMCRNMQGAWEEVLPQIESLPFNEAQ
jgi:sorting nexin-1/2